MTDRTNSTDQTTEEPTQARQPGARSNPDRAEDVDPDVRTLLGMRPPEDEGITTSDQIETLGQMTDTRVYQGDLEARPTNSDQPDDNVAENLELLTDLELREGETDDPNEAAEEGLAWVPPIDPPLRIGDEGPEVAAGFGTTADEEPFDSDHRSAALSPHDELESRVLEALRADAATAGLAEDLDIDAEGAVVRIAGQVEDIEDEDAIMAVAEGVDGVGRVDSRIVVRAVAETEPDRA